MNKPEVKPKLGIGYSKETKKGDAYINITVNLAVLAEILASVKPSEKSIKVGLFSNQTEFRKETTPDYNLVHLSNPQQQEASQSATRPGAVNAKPKGSNFPF